MPLKNYTSSVPAKRSIQYIEMKLAKHGANQILKEFDDPTTGKVTSLSFSIAMQGRILHFKLPVRLVECERILMSETTQRTRPETIKKIPAQAERTAWKIQSDWVDAQMAMIELAQVELAEVFMPYVICDQSGKTLYAVATENGFKKMLPAGK